MSDAPVAAGQTALAIDGGEAPSTSSSTTDEEGSAPSAGAITRDLLDRLRRHYIRDKRHPGGVFVPECGINGAQGASRRCDALYVGFTSRSGRQLIGHELKVSKSDWQHELDQATKADTWADACHQWYVVAPSAAVVDPETLPTGWGLMLPNKRGSRMTIVVKARVQPDDFNPPWNAVRSIMARIDTLQAEERSQVRADLRKEAEQELERRLAMRTEPDVPHEYREARQTLDRIQDHWGIQLDRFAATDGRSVTPDQLATAIALVKSCDNIARHYRGAAHVAAELERTATQLRELEKNAAACASIASG